MKSIVTEHSTICFICGRKAEAEHHLIFGTAGRKLSEKDGLKVPICNNCHNMGDVTRRIHGNPIAERMSKIIGQLVWEREQMIGRIDPVYAENDEDRKMLLDNIQEKFRKRYSISYL